MQLKVRKLSHVALSCHSLEYSLAFYRDTLGFEVNDSLGSKNGNVKLNIGSGSYLELFPFAMYQSQKQGVLAHFAIEVDSLDDTKKFLRSKNIRIVRGPFSVSMPNGSPISKVLFICGPDGEELEFVERVES